MRAQAEHDSPQAATAMNLVTGVYTPFELTPVERSQMLKLMLDHYVDVDPTAFERDLAEKDWVIVTRDAAKGILGFTTLCLLTAHLENGPFIGLFSGDTAFAPDVWGSSGWVRVWGKHVTKVVKDLDRGPIPWLLLTATHRTYRFLPAFFREYYPGPTDATPKHVLDSIRALVQLKFPEQFDSKAGVVRPTQRLRVRQDRIASASEGLDHPDARFFVDRNPSFLDGDYLACLTYMHQDNYTRLGRKLFLDSDSRQKAI